MMTDEASSTSRAASLQNKLLKDSVGREYWIQTSLFAGSSIGLSLAVMLPWIGNLWPAVLVALWASASLVSSLGVERLFTRNPKDNLALWDYFFAGAAVSALLAEWAFLPVFLLGGVVARNQLSRDRIKQKGGLRCRNCSTVASKEHDFCPNCELSTLDSEIQSE